MSGPSATAWTGKTRGGRFGNWWFLMLLRCFGVWPAYVWLAFVAAWFTLFADQERRASRQLLERLLGPQPFWKWPGLVFRHFYSSGVTLLDRVAVIIGRAQMQFDFTDEAEVFKALAEERGVILLAAHVGSWELGGHLMARHGRPVNLVVLEREEQHVREMFDQALGAKKFDILTANDDPLRSIPIVAALRRGELVALHGDRTFGGGATVRMPFLGEPASFPTGPYLLAAATGAPIIHVFAMRTKMRHYRFIAFPARNVRRERGLAQGVVLRECVAEYIEHLTTVVKRYPFQWYNFYPFWDDDAR